MVELRLCVDCGKPSERWTGAAGEHPNFGDMREGQLDCCHDDAAGWYWCATSRNLLARPILFRPAPVLPEPETMLMEARNLIDDLTRRVVLRPERRERLVDFVRRHDVRAEKIRAEAEPGAEFEEAVRDCGITPKGRELALVMWRCAREILAAAPFSEPPFDVAEMATRMLRDAAAVEERRRFKSRRTVKKEGRR